MQHERIFQLALDGGPDSFPPLKTESPKSASDALAERIERHVGEMVEKSLAGSLTGESAAQTTKSTLFGLGNLLLVVIVILVIVWLVRRVLF